MPCITYVERAFRPDILRRIQQANVILAEYRADGLVVTLRQLYYQFVARGLLANTMRNYQQLSVTISNARLAGLIDWDAIEDRTRNLMGLSSWDDPSDIIASSAYSYREDLWRTQNYRPEVWVEKEALAGVIQRTCNRLRVPFLACRGYMSQSEMHAAGKRLEGYSDEGKTPIVFHLGDHDPSGLDMTRDNTDRLEMFAAEAGIQLERLALNMDQVRRYNPPPNPAKETDSRHGEYAALYGNESWELDALDPKILDGLVTTAVLAVRDEDAWTEALEQEREQREVLRKTSRRWSEVVTFLDSLD